MTRFPCYIIAIAVAALCSYATAASAAKIKHVFVIAMENTDAQVIYKSAPGKDYLADLIAAYAHADIFVDELQDKQDKTHGLDVPSEPHYIYMEAGTNVFADHAFTKDSSPSAANSTKSTDHLVTQLTEKGLSWRTYQEVQVTKSAGSCLIHTFDHYAPKHNPFIFFQDVSGSPPQKSTNVCAAHIKPYSAFAADLARNDMASYVFITPDLCHDMHDRCGDIGRNAAGNLWLKAEMPRLIAWANANEGVIFLTWDEGSATGKMPFLAIGAHVKPHYAGPLLYDHGSMLLTVERIFGVTPLPSVKTKNDLADLFEPGYYP